MIRHQLKDCGIKGKVLVCLALLSFLGGLAAAPALAQAPAGPEVSPGTPAGAAPAEEKKEEVPTTAGPMITDYTIPIDQGKLAMNLMLANEFGVGNFSNSWRLISAHENFYNFYANAKLTYGLAKNLETYVVVPVVYKWITDADRSIAGPNGERNASYGGIGDITVVGKYLLLPETDCRPAVAAVGGVTAPSGHASHLNPRFLGADSTGAGAVIFYTGFNLFKYIKPFLVYGQFWFQSPVNLYEQRDNNIRSRDTVTANLAVEYPLTKQWILLAEIFTNWTWTNINPINQSFATTQTQIGVAPGIEYLINDKWSCQVTGGFELFGKNGDTEYFPMAAVTYTF
jgi:Putative MetA-pathway of phenol degradation